MTECGDGSFAGRWAMSAVRWVPRGLCLVAMIGASRPAFGQPPPRAPRFAWETVPLNSLVRIVTDSTTLTARFAGIASDTLLLSQCERGCQPRPTPAIRLPLDVLSDALVQHGHHAAEGVRDGILAGAFVGAGVGLLIGKTDELSAGAMVAATTLSGMVVGSGAGHFIGAARPRWFPVTKVETPAGALQLGVLLRSSQ